MKKFGEVWPCSGCGVFCRGKYETVVSRVDPTAPDTVYSTLHHFCDPCLDDHLHKRLWRRWVPLGKPTQFQLDWLKEAQTLLTIYNSGELTSCTCGEAKGRHLLKLLPAGQSLEDPDLLLAVDQFPFTYLGSPLSGTDYLDLDTLIRCWSRGILSQDCPQCHGVSSFHVFQIFGSILNAKASWWGFCRECGSVLNRHSTGVNDTMSHWIGEFSKAKEAFGRSLQSAGAIRFPETRHMAQWHGGEVDKS